MSRYVALTIATFALVAPSAAAAAGGPIAGGDAGPAGVTHGAERYVALAARGRTMVLRIERDGGIVQASRVLPHLRVFPVVSADATPTGVSGDGGTLVLADAVFPRRRSAFTLLDARTLRRTAEITLQGDFALDAISPAGDRLYLIQTFRSGRYAVRAYDVSARRLVAAPVVDPAEPDEPMIGVPLARVMSHDARWAYTLYDRGADAPFIHALDTQAGVAKCVDLDGVGPVDGLIMGSDGKLIVRSGDAAVRVVDLRTFAVRAPRPVVSAPSPAPVAEDGGAGWLAPVAGGAFLALLAALALRAGGMRFRPRLR